jgi:Fe-S cluster assembly scaffold protein SufB
MDVTGGEHRWRVEECVHETVKRIVFVADQNWSLVTTTGAGDAGDNMRWDQGNIGSNDAGVGGRLPP